MCDPVTIGLGTLQVLGGIKDAKAQKAAGEYKAQIFEQNAKVAEYASADAVARGAVEEEKALLETGALVGKQKTAFSASGVRTDTGSPVDVMATTRGLGEWNAATIRSNAARAAWGYDTEAQNFRAQAKLARMAGANAADSALITGYTRGAASLRYT